VQNGVDLVIASRYASAEETARKWLPRLIARLAHLLLPSINQVKDPLSGFFLMKREWLDDLELRPASYKILLNILTDGKVRQIKEVPYYCQEKTSESIKSNNLLKPPFPKKDLGRLASSLEQILFLSTKGGELGRFIKFCLVGASGIGISTAVFWLLFNLVGLHDLIALPLSVEVSIISGFTLNNLWTFRDKKANKLKDSIKRALKFNLVSLISMLLYFAIYAPLTRLLGLYEPLAFLIAVGAGVIWNFSMSLLWTWRTKMPKNLPDFRMGFK
jgi:dolichol-phosphate mannosyltransferase